jgi:hypothetical protein
VVIGGEPLDGHRYMFWNFVSSRKERVVQAGEDWEAQRFPQVPGETERIPLPARNRRRKQDQAVDMAFAATVL